MFFFFKQKTAYEMRISDWSSDVCSSDLCGDLLVEVLRQHVDLLLVLAGVVPQLDLRQHLVGEAGAHHEAGVAGAAAQVDEPALGEQQDPFAVGELDLVDLRLDVAIGRASWRERRCQYV